METVTEKRWNFGSREDRYDPAIIDAVPDYTLEAIERYVQTGCSVGDFVTAVIENDLLGACGRADNNNLPALHAIVKVLYNYCPSGCWGHREKRLAWQRKGGLKGLGYG